MSKIFLIFPHQLFKELQVLRQYDLVILIEEYLFFRQYKFHQQKLVLHRASMRNYADYLTQNEIPTSYIESTQPENDVRVLLESLPGENIHSIGYYDVCDDWLQKRIEAGCKSRNIPAIQHPSPGFLTSLQELEHYFGPRQSYFQTDFYIWQRKRLGILVDPQQKPVGGRWSFDADNRKKYPREKRAPEVVFPEINHHYREAMHYVATNFYDHFGVISTQYIYPTTHDESETWLQQFLETRLAEFGTYEDAIVEQENILHHSVLTPMLNIGLLTPHLVVESTLEFAAKHSIPLNSLEGFIRQIIGWREFIRGVYLYRGRQERTTNFWQFNKAMPASFYDGTTGILPFDNTVKKVLNTAYCHHIERLMIAGNLMLLSEIHPDRVYQWFMELFIDAYDWVMVPNVYGMSQFADGGMMATKPYISGSSYLLKMSNYPKGEWSGTWDALFWRFMNQHRKFFTSNPRLGMLIGTYDKMAEDRKLAIEAHYRMIMQQWHGL